ncbi:neuropilin and tolloid-like protein 1 isoform X2 [Ostrea edulis]|uniref:neuropilin and tolloid-like protein 1 isoform X2 n=1 Tax=Ostrea edulis TaxID=37623 RepID=UPI002094CC40|nr:neuropilin and tolloid-like protein 1 isoform X2 [Ostrea edulis]XP_056009078.1 neuropilin and tolloid-like protein 1 isoform X2 [Ostrea edulis]
MEGLVKGFPSAMFLLVCSIWILNSSYANRTDAPNSLTYNHQHLLGNKIDHACTNFTFGSMEFYSPNYPGKYPNNLECVRAIEAQPGFEIQLDFREKFDMESSENKECRYDYLEVRDGPFGYSQLFGRYCGKRFPPLLISKGRYLWLRFISDKAANYTGFKGVYSFIKKENYKPEMERLSVCRTPISHMHGSLSSAGMSTLLNGNVDCTWEIQAPPRSKIFLSNFKVAWRVQLSSPCDSTRIEVYETSTAQSSLKGSYCMGFIPDIVIDSSVAFIRVFSPALSIKPEMTFSYTILREANRPTFITATFDSTKMNDLVCSSFEFMCDKSCLSRSLLCDGIKNCPSGQDETKCEGKEEDSEVPVYVIVAGIVGGVLVTAIIIIICASLYCKENRKRKERELAKHQEKIKDNSIEMSSNSTTTTLGSKKGVPPVGYFSLPRSHGGKNYKDHRNSLTNSQSASEGDYPDQSSDQGTYKKFTVIDPYMDDETSPTLYNQSPCLTTIIERHDMPPQTELDGTYGWTGYGWKQPPSTLTENLAKLARYNMPQHEQQHPQKMYKYSPENKMYMDPKYEMYQEQKMLMNKDYKMKYGTPADKESSLQDDHNQKQFQMKIQDPDITRDLEVT